jgi:serine/threonine-protein kinase
LSAGATSPTTLPFTGLLSPEGVAVDAAGNIYVADFRNLDATSTHQGRVLRLAAGATTATELPFADLNGPQGVAVDRAGNVYVADSGNRRVLKLPAGATSAVELPFTGLHGPVGIAVDEGGNVYVTDVDINTAGRAFKLAPGATAAAELPFTAPMQLYRPRSIAVDAAGGVYVTSSDELDMVKAQSSPYPKQVFHDASLDLSGVTVDNTGNIYIADRLGKRVVKLPPDNS